MAVYVKAVLAGLLGALVAPVLLIVVLIGGSIMIESAGQTFGGVPDGSGGIGAVSVGISELAVLLAAAVGFAAGYGAVLRRARRRRTPSHA